MFWRLRAFLIVLALVAFVACGPDSLAPIEETTGPRLANDPFRTAGPTDAAAAPTTSGPSLAPVDGGSETNDVDIPTTEGCLKYCYSLDDLQQRAACLRRCAKGSIG